MSQEALSNETGIGVTHISKLENGHKEPRLNNMATLGRAFGLKPLPALAGCRRSLAT
ncbi:helix-turn-helix domain-containing protein [Tunturiibacter psychrotolerans]|uniref:helix-turn-helix domain-containing protein n=1 Tax=Tunturiibacter psychrotolerans TaxID=3069686 RepID=UPI00333F21AC